MITHDLEVSLNLAVSEAARRGHEYVTVEHLLYALLFNESAVRAIKSCNGSVEVTRSDIEKFFETHFGTNPLRPGEIPQPTLAFQRVIQRAAQQVRSAGKDRISGAHVLVAIFSEQDSFAVYSLRKQSIRRIDIINFISHRISKPGAEPTESIAGATPEEGGLIPQNGDEFDPDEDPTRAPFDPQMEPQDDPRKQPRKDPLALYAVNLCEKAKKGEIDPLIGRDNELERAAQILSRRRKNNPLFVGESGVGKTALVEGLAHKIVGGQVPPALKDATIYALDIGSVLAGSRFRGDFEERIKGLLNALKKKKGSILFIDEIHTVIGAGSVSGGTLDASNLLKPALASGAIRCIGSSTYKEFRQHFEHDHALARRFQKIDVEEPSIDETVKILKGLKQRYEDFHGVKYSNEALEEAANLSAKYLRDKKLPDKAIDIIDEIGATHSVKRLPLQDKYQEKSQDKPHNKDQADAGSEAAHEHDKDRKHSDHKKRKTITANDIREIVAKMTRIPPERVTATDREALASLDGGLKKVVFGQDDAINRVITSIKLSRAGLGSAEKPIGSFLFAGPTGVGKTEVAKQLATHLGIAFLRFDMSEYAERHTISRLLGAPPGYVGFDQGGLLTDAVHQNPHSVLLLDEIEKAHADLHNILLQVMDHGTLTDTNGRKADMRNVILIMTTNAGARELTQGYIGFARGPGVTEKGETEAIKTMFSPEFRNRLDAIITFSSLSKETVLMIVDKFLREIEVKLDAKKVTLSVTDAAREWIATTGFDPAYGARPLYRLIQDKIKQPLADELLFGKLIHGGKVTVDIANAALHFEYC